MLVIVVLVIVVAVAFVFPLELPPALLLHLGLLLALNVVVQVTLGDEASESGRHDLLRLFDIEGCEKPDDAVAI
jgi:hypothetical protein